VVGRHKRQRAARQCRQVREGSRRLQRHTGTAASQQLVLAQRLRVVHAAAHSPAPWQPPGAHRLAWVPAGGPAAAPRGGTTQRKRAAWQRSEVCLRAHCLTGTPRLRAMHAS
jgi:hypothetical protein